MLSKDIPRAFQLLLLWSVLVVPSAAQDLVLYDDALASGFEEWSWAVQLPPRSATLVAARLENGSELIFADGFESGDVTAWSGVTP